MPGIGSRQPTSGVLSILPRFPGLKNRVDFLFSEKGLMDTQFHEVANIFPLLEGEELQALVEDIRQNGQIEPIWTYQGKIIDGRNRYRACRELGIEPKYREWDGDGSLVQFVVSLNLYRRHLTSSQKAVVAVDILPMLEAEARGRQRKAGQEYGRGQEKVGQIIDRPIETQRATQKAAELTGTNRQYVSDAKKIAQQAPEVLEKVRDGVLTIPDAKKVAALPEVKRQEVIERVAQEGINNLKNIVREAAHQEKRAQPLPTGQYDVIIADPLKNTVFLLPKGGGAWIGGLIR